MKDGGPAFPTTRFGKVTTYGYEGQEIEQTTEVAVPGMSLRDWFAGQALQSYLTSADSLVHGNDAIAAAAYGIADAMLKAREV